MKGGHSTLLAPQRKVREVVGNHGMSRLMPHAEGMLDRVGYQYGAERVDGVMDCSIHGAFHAREMYLEN
jgi:hypothetical protein